MPLFQSLNFTKKTFLFCLSIFSISVFSAEKQKIKCNTVFYEVALTRLTSFDPKNTVPQLRYSFNSDLQHREGQHLTYGFESEYTFEESAPLLEFYGPDPKNPNPELRMSEQEWLALTSEQRMAWIKKNIMEKPLLAKDSGLVRLTHNANELDFLPDKLVLDSTGNLEFVLPPTDSLEHWYSQAQKINARFGAGSMQAMVSAPVNGFFNKGPGISLKDATEENLGYFNFIHDYDVIEKLDAGAKRFKKDPTKAVANSFNHPYLGPMTLAKQKLMHAYLEGNPRGEKIDLELDLKPIRQTDRSFKYIGSTAYRPDIGMPQNRVAMEVRDAHKNLELLVKRVLRSTHEIQEGALPHQRFAKLKAFDSQKDYMKLPEDVRGMLEKVFKPKNEDPNDPELERLAAQVYRNFSYPLRDWSEHLNVFQKTNLSAKVEREQRNYQDKLATIAVEFNSASISKEQASVQIQGALALFIEQSEIGQMFADWQRLHPTSDKLYNSYLNLALNHRGPLKESFPETVWEGPLTERIHQLSVKYPGQVKWVQKGDGKDILVLSTYGLSTEKKEQLEKDYINAIARGTISSPDQADKENGAIRLGTNLFGFTDRVTQEPYSLRPERREIIRQLSPKDELRLRYNIEQSQKAAGAKDSGNPIETILQNPNNGSFVVFSTEKALDTIK